MKKYARVYKYLRSHVGEIVLYFVFTLLSIVFSLVSLGTLPFFLRLIFFRDQLVLTKPANISGSNEFVQWINYQLSIMIKDQGDNGAVVALAAICGLIIVTILLKNLFLYLSLYIMNPIKNSIATQLRAEVYSKLLQLRGNRVLYRVHNV